MGAVAGVALLIASALGGAGCASIEERVTALEDRTGGIEDRLAQLESRQETLLSRFEEIGQEFERGLGPMRSQQADRGEDLRALQSQTAALQERIALLEERIGELTEKLATATSRSPASPPGADDEADDRLAAPMPLPRDTDAGAAADEGRQGDTGNRSSPPSTAAANRARGESAGVESAAVLYRTAYNDYLKGNYSIAIAGFRQYMERYRDSRRVDNALYWIGESQYAQGDYNTARGTFQRLVRTHPGSDVVPGAMLKAALALLQLGEPSAATEELRRLVTAHPTQEEARLACLQLDRLDEELPPACSGTGSR